MPNLKYQTLEVKYPSGTTAGFKKDHEIVLDSQMDKVVGIAMYPISNGGVDPVRIALRDRTSDIQPFTHQDDYIDKGTGGYYDRKKPLDVVAKGNTIKLDVDIPADLTADLKFDVVFILKNEV